MELTNINYVDRAEDVILKLKEEGRGRIRLTTSQIRNILTITSTIYDNAKRKKGPLDEEELMSVQLLRTKFVYESGRDKNVEQFIQMADLINLIKSVGDSREKLILFCKYMEALVAYHRFEGGKDS